MADIQIEELVAQVEAEAIHLEASDRSSFKLDEDALVERITSRIINAVNAKIKRLITHLREEGDSIVQMISVVRADSRSQPSRATRSPSPSQPGPSS